MKSALVLPFVVALVLAASVAASPDIREARAAADWMPAGNPPLLSDRAFDTTQLGPHIESVMASGHVPGMAALIVRGGEVFWSGAFGWADIEQGIPVTDTTSFTLASVSKTVTALAAMHTWERGAFGLQDAINDYLPFAVVNPNYPSTEITPNMLLRHTSTLSDNWSMIDPLSTEGDCPVALGYFLEQYVTPGGEYYTSSSFSNCNPGTIWSYSNTGIAMAGYLVEAVSGMPFYDYCRDSIFIPLGMPHTSFRLSYLDLANVAMPYAYSGGEYIPYGHMCHVPYPAGSLFSSTRDLARHLIAFMQFGVYDTVRVLDSATVAFMRTPQSGHCIVWFTSGSGDDLTYEHSGGDWGAKTMISCRPTRGVGVIVLANANSASVVSNVVSALYGCAQLYEVGIEPDAASGWAPLEVAFSGAAYQPVSSWTWDFGDGDSAYVAAPVHVYDAPGVFEARLDVVTSGGDTLAGAMPATVAVLADTLRADTVETWVTSDIESIISITNHVPLNVISIPVQFEGPLDLDPDSVSWSNEGCRTAAMGPAVRTHHDPLNKQMTFTVASETALPPGSGPVLKLCFRADSLSAPGDAADILLEGYDELHVPVFSGPYVEYTARAVNGAIVITECCQGMTGNIDGDQGNAIDIADLVWMVNYVFKDGPRPPCMAKTDVNGDEAGPDIADLVQLVNYMFKDGPAPALCP